MNESDGRRRPGLARWLTDKVEGLAAGRRPGPAAPARPAPPDPAMQRQAAEIQRLKGECDRLAKELDDTKATLMGKEAEFKNDLQEVQERNAELLDKIVKLTQRDRELQAKVLDAKFDGTGAKDQVKKLDTDLRDQRRAVKAGEEQITALKAQLETLQKEAAERPDPKKSAADAAELTRRLQEALSQVQALSKERDGLKTQLKERPEAATAPDSPDSKEDEMIDDDSSPTRGHVVNGKASDPLKTMAAGKLPEVARKLQEARQRRGAAAQKLLDNKDRGFATLPDGFVEALLDKKSRRRTTGEHRASRRGGSTRNRGRNRGRSRSRSPRR